MRLILLGLPSKKPPGEGPLSRNSPGDWLLHLRTRERPCFPWPYRGAFNKRLPLGWRIKLVDARRISVHEHRETLAIPFHASRDEPLPVVRATQRWPSSNRRALWQGRERHRPTPDLEHRETLAIPFHASRDEPLPVVRATQRWPSSNRRALWQVRERHRPIPDLA